VTHIDTHVAVWLYEKDLARFTPRGLTTLRAGELQVSPFVVLELEYLFEVGKIREHGETVINDLRQRLDLQFCLLPVGDVVTAAIEESWTRDPFDRLLTATARRESAQLLTKDKHIRRHFPGALW